MGTRRLGLISLIAVAGCLFGTAAVWAHFLVLVPGNDVLGPGDPRHVEMDIRFTHPMEQGPVMDMDRPQRFGLTIGERTVDLLSTLQPQTVDGARAYSAKVQFSRPGDQVLFLEPAPYWEPAEHKMIVHYTKVIVNYMGDETGWDRPVGLPVEIVPLVRPYGLWTGNTFRGIVHKDGRPVPFATVEVEYLNDQGEVTPPNDAFVTQVVKADADGVFSYTMPKHGWWGFAALIDGDQPMTAPTGEEVPVELGGLIWVRTVDMQ